MFCDHCGDCYELLTDIRVLNQLTNLLGGTWTVWICAGCGHFRGTTSCRTKVWVGMSSIYLRNNSTRGTSPLRFVLTVRVPSGVSNSTSVSTR